MKFPTEKNLQEFQNDKFDYTSLSEMILNKILLEMELPNCFGLYGNWGSGKSTILHYIKKHLEGIRGGAQKILTVHFEPWKYEYSDKKDLLFALLNCIKKESKTDNRIWKKLLVDAIAALSGVLRETKIINMQDTVTDFNILEKKFFKEHQSWIDKIEEFKNDFEKIIKKILQKRNSSKLIVFIDDLDRCLPENAVKLLESIKNFLSVESTLFVLAIDRRVISEMIEKKYGLHDGYGDEYLMKIIPYFFELPTVNLKDIVNGILRDHGIRTFTERQSGYIIEFLRNNEAREPRVAKYIINQFCMNILLVNGVKGEIEQDLKNNTSGRKLEYAFIASFLLTKFPKLFLVTLVSFFTI